MDAITVSDLEKEVSLLVTSAGSLADIQQHAPGLTRLAAEAGARGEVDPDGVMIQDGRQLLLAGIEWLRQTRGRSADDGRRDQRAYSDYAEAASLLFGDDAAALGKEKRYGAVAELIGSSKDVPITGKRFSKRVCFHVAAAITKRLTSVEPANQLPRYSAPLDPAAQRLLERAKLPENLVHLAQSRKLLRAEPWLHSLAAALTAALAEVGADASRLEGLSASTLDFDPVDRFAVQLLLFEAARQLGITSPSGTWLLDALSSPAHSRALPAAATHLRVAASMVLFKWNLARPGTNVDPGSNLPQVALVPISADTPNRLISKYPITIQQYYSVVGDGMPNSVRDLTLPITSVSLDQAQTFCATFRDRAADAGQVLPILRGGKPRQEAVQTNWTIRLPTQADVNACLGNLRFPWSGSVDESVALARRRSYDHLIPVGLFPDERTPTGVADLGGLIWQWLDTPWPNAQGQELTMVHGGGFGKNEQFFRSDCFLGADPTTRRADRGFRIVVEF